MYKQREAGSRGIRVTVMSGECSGTMGDIIVYASVPGIAWSLSPCGHGCSIMFEVNESSRNEREYSVDALYTDASR